MGEAIPVIPGSSSDVSATTTDQNQQLVDTAFAEWKERLAKAKQSQSASQYWAHANLGLLACVVAIAAWYYWYHLESLFTQALFVGIPLTVWTLIEVFRNAMPFKIFESDQRSLVKLIINHPRGTSSLCFTALVLLFANLGTASIHLKHVSGTDDVEIQLVSNSRPFTDNMEVSEKEPNQSRFYFCRGKWLCHPVDLKVNVIAPVDYQAKPDLVQRKLYPWSAVTWKFPDDFEKARYWICRVIPSKGLLSLPPLKEGKHPSSFEIEFIVDGIRPKEKQTASFNCFYFGSDLNAMQRKIDSESSDDREKRIVNRIPEISAEKAKSLALMTPLRFMAEGLKPQARVQVILWGNKQKLFESKIITVPSEAGIFDLVLELEE